MSMSAEVVLNTPRDLSLATHLSKKKKKGMPQEYVLIERNLQYSFKRFKDEIGYYWVHFPEKKSNLTARVYPDLHRRHVRVAVFEQDRSAPKDTTKGTRIRAWTVDIAMDGEWTEDLSKLAGRAITQSEKQPRCFCDRFLFLRQRKNDGRQFFGCPQFPNCTQTATIGKYEATMDSNLCPCLNGKAD